MATLTIIKKTTENFVRNIESGIYYFAYIAENNGKILKVIRFKITESGITEYLNISEIYFEIQKTNNYNKEYLTNLFFEMLEEQSTLYGFKYQRIDNDTFIRYYNEFYQVVVPGEL